ncbi:MAG: hypothetical protein ACI8TQ_002454 [Planctomycetota bacterium]|jgi:hypothetical protein
MISFSTALFVLIPASLAPIEPSAPQSTPPNILILLLDDIGVDGLSAYDLGSDLPNTPVIDGMAQDGMRFDNVWSNPVCSPTRSTIQTGRYVFRTGIGYTVTELTNALPQSEVTLPEMLKISGVDYASAAFGKWHLGSSDNGGPLAPNIAGYDHYSGGLINLHPPQNYNSWVKTTNGQTSQVDRYITSETVTEARDWIKDQKGLGPWLAYVAFHSPHTPHHAPPSNLHTVDLSTAGTPIDDPRPYWKAMVESVDTEIGRLFAEIDIDFNQTIVILLGDNGTNQTVILPPFEPTHGKGTAYQGGVQVPMIIKGTGVANNSSCVALINTSDLFATVAEIAGAKYPALFPNKRPNPGSGIYSQGTTVPQTIAGNALDSISIAPYFVAPDLPSLRKFVWTELYRPSTDVPPTIIRQAIRNQRYKLLMRTTPTAGEEILFFDLSEDPHESNNLLGIGELTPIQQTAFDALAAQAENILSSK